MNPDNKIIIKPREREALIRSLRSGVVPSVGLQHIQVGRHQEVQSMLRDIDTVADGGATFRLVIGEYGSGKTFFLSLVRRLALERGLVTMNADLSPIKRFHSSNGLARNLLTDLTASLSTRTKSDGQGLETILEALIAKATGQPLSTLLRPLEALPGGHSFCRVINIYATATEDLTRSNALRWLQAQYSTRSDSLRDLGVRDFLDDAMLFPALRLYAAMVRIAGYKGLYVLFDELVNLYKIANAPARKANYEEILALLNNILQGNIQGLGILMSGTPEFLTDTRRGLYSYEALRSRLAENNFAASGLRDYDSTVLRLANLTREEMFVLLKNIRRLFVSENPTMESRLPNEALTAFLHHCYNKIGEDYFRTPRNTIKGFIDLASLLRQYPETTWQQLLPGIDVTPDIEPSPLHNTPAATPDDLADFRL